MSDETKLPARFEPSGPVEESPAKPDIPEMVVTEEEAIAIIKEQGGVNLPPSTMSNLAKVGVYISSVGILRLKRGEITVSLEQAKIVMKAVATTLEEGTLIKKQPSGKWRRRLKVRDVKDLAAAYTDIFKAVTEAQQALLESSGSRSGINPKGGDDIAAVVKSFRQGAVVEPPPGSGRTNIVAQHVHITQPADAAKQ